MANAAKDRGYRYLAVTDHIKALKIVRGLNEEKLVDQGKEIDAYPDRQDLKLSLLRLALKEGARISLGTDAHHPWQLAFMDFALAAALLAGFPKDRIVNFMTLQELRRWSSK
jgi:histidinol phosphatase-like PHP family hydrolase